mmetsp:Transcript_52925/g.139389  ORF Transcript_52925/g.139389 Transcript_52925/m.139389 type:complete len:251 (-) Transcript_52925:255-1007(-)
MPRCKYLRRCIKSSTVTALRFTFTRMGIRSTSSCPRRSRIGSPTTSRHVRGGMRNSASPGYCDRNCMEAPTSIRLASISNTIPLFFFAPLYSRAVFMSVVVDKRPNSTPPLKSDGLLEMLTMFALIPLQARPQDFSSHVSSSFVKSNLDSGSEITNRNACTSSITATRPGDLSADFGGSSMSLPTSSRRVVSSSWSLFMTWAFCVTQNFFRASTASLTSMVFDALNLNTIWHSTKDFQNWSGSTIPPSPR